jgi:hypothetical protein
MLKYIARWVDTKPVLGVSIAFAVIVSTSLGVWFAKRYVDEIPAADVAVISVPTFEVTREKLQDKLPNALDELAALPPIPEPEPELPPLDIDVDLFNPSKVEPVTAPVPKPRAEARRSTRTSKPLLVRDCEAIFGTPSSLCNF